MECIVATSKSKNVIVEFFDYNCSYCKKAHQDILKTNKIKM